MKNKIRYIGIDLSTTPEDIGCCTLTESVDGTLELTDSPITKIYRGTSENARKALLEFVKTRVMDCECPIVVALDVPFGWPKLFSAAVSNHTVGKTFGEEKREQYRYRNADLFLREILHRESGPRAKLHPLSVSTDRLGLTAIWASDLIQDLVENLGFEIDLGIEPVDSERQKTLIEVYPAASFFSWHPVVWNSQRNESAESKFTQYSNAMLSFANHHFDVFPVTPNEIKNRNHLDAFICAMTAKSYAEKNCYTPRDASAFSVDADTLSREGWIWVPKVGPI